MENIYIVRSRDMSIIRRVKAKSEKQALSKFKFKHGEGDFLVYQF